MDENTSKILIVDDNKDIHEDIRYILDSTVTSAEYIDTLALKDELFGSEEAGLPPESIFDIKYRIDDAYQGEEAIRMVKKAKDDGNPYSLIFMDVRMPPGIDGIKAIEEIWRIEPAVEVVICTAYSDYSWDQILAKLGPNDHLLFIKKPFDSVSVKQIALSMTTKWNLQRQIRAHIMNLEAEVEKRTKELKVLVEKLSYNAQHDALTDLLNRRSFYSALSTVIDNSSKVSGEFSLFFIDIDNFKSVNDVMGHDVGDHLLVQVSERLKSNLGEHAFNLNEFKAGGHFSQAIFRLGGDEFTALVSSGSRETVARIAEKLLAAIKEPYDILNREVKISCSIGISRYPADSAAPDALLKYADIALYEAKKTNGVYMFCDSSSTPSIINERRLEDDLSRALEKKQLEVYYQCMVNTSDSVIGVQALARWKHPELGTLQPDRFIHIAERTDQIISIGEYILNTALLHLDQMHKAGYGDLFLLVSCTTRQFYHPGFAAMVKKALESSGTDPRYLKLGLEERFTLQTTDKTLAIINELNKMGVSFSFNGFESEYPAFLFLQKMPRDTLIKFDKSYVTNITTDTKNREFLLSLIDMIKSWDLDIIISGVETEAQKSILNKKDCILQGYHFNVPKPFGQFLEELKRIY